MIGITRHGRQVNPFFERRPGTHPYLVHDGVIGKCDGDTPVIGNAARISLIADHVAAVAVRAAIRCQEVPTGRQGCAGRDCQLVRDAEASTARPANLPATHIDRAVAVVVEFDELIARAAGAAGPELADHNWRGRRRRHGRRGRRCRRRTRARRR